MVIKRHFVQYAVTLCTLIGSGCADPDIANEPQLASAMEEACEYEVTGTSSPPSSGNPTVIDNITGTVISANFFNSGAIDPPYFDGEEQMSVCVHMADNFGNRGATITTDVGLDNDFQIKGYPEFIVGTKFGNIYETSFRYYPNTNLPLADQWPVVATGAGLDGIAYEFANLEYISTKKNVGLPAFTTSLPEITVIFDVDEVNVVGAERDVMLESWFHDTSTNQTKIGNNVATNTPIAGTLNNIVGVGHKHYPELDNTLLEMMVHVGPLSPQDISGAKNNPGQNQLTEIYSGKDFDGDGIDDHFDVDSHLYIDSTDPSAPDAGIYSSGIDNDGDGIDDADLLPVIIGNFAYSIWYGESFLAPIVIYSRETNSSLSNDFNPATADMDLTTEGEIQLRWNDFLEYTLYDLEPTLQALNVSWSLGSSNPFPAMRGISGAVSGVEFGVEPQTNSPADENYQLLVNKFIVDVDGSQSGLLPVDLQPPDTSFSLPAFNGEILSENIIFSGTATDQGGSGVEQIEVAIRDLNAQLWIDFNGGFSNKNVRLSANLANTTIDTTDWNLPVSLEPGSYRIQAVVFDGARNNSGWIKRDFVVVAPDNQSPQGTITNPLDTLGQDDTITGTATDTGGSGFGKIEVAIRDLNAQLWIDFNGGFSNKNVRRDASLTNTNTSFTDWNLPVSLEPGRYRVQAVVFDGARNNSGWIKQDFVVVAPDVQIPQGVITYPTDALEQNDTITGTATDIGDSGIDKIEVAIRDLNAQLWIDFNGGFSNKNVRRAASLTNTTINATDWNFPVNLEPGSYRVQVVVFDGARNNSGWIKQDFVVSVPE